MEDANHVTDYEDLVGMPLIDIARSEKVVIFASGLTDTRMIVRYLTDRSVPFRVIEMGMGSMRSRVDFRHLCEMTDWHLLPQIFVDGIFIGGMEEFFAHPTLAGDAAIRR
jgi:glutaredoxin-related protein